MTANELMQELLDAFVNAPDPQARAVAYKALQDWKAEHGEPLVTIVEVPEL